MENNKLTPKKRAEIYFKLAKTYNSKKYINEEDSSICLDLECIFNGDKPYDWLKKSYDTYYQEVLNLFPEIADFIKNRKESFTQELRITALLFAYQMALDAKE